MIITTTQSIERKEIVTYHGVVFGEVIAGINAVKDLFAGFKNFVGGRSNTYEKELAKARSKAIQEMEERAEKLGANAIVGMRVDVEVLGEGGNMLMVNASGTAVSVQ